MSRNRVRSNLSLPDNALPTNLEGVYALPPPPENFYPLTANNRILKMYGLPSRPDAKKNPQALRAWKRALSRPIGRFIQPVFTAVPEVTRGRPRPRGPGSTFNAGSTWAGCILSGNNWATVWARWTVPMVIPPANPGSQTEWQCSTWVGIDSSLPDNDILQAGTHQGIAGSGEVFVGTSYAWWEWFVDEKNAPPEQLITGRCGTNFPIGFGDTVDVLVGGSDQGGYIQFSNVSRSLYTAFAVPIPANAVFKGNFIEWILEQPLTQLAGATTKTRLPLPDFGTVTFHNAGGCSVEKENGNPQNGTTTTITDDNGDALTSEALGDSSVTINYAS
jgi:hypothetical protein